MFSFGGKSVWVDRGSRGSVLRWSGGNGQWVKRGILEELTAGGRVSITAETEAVLEYFTGRYCKLTERGREAVWMVESGGRCNVTEEPTPAPPRPPKMTIRFTMKSFDSVCCTGPAPVHVLDFTSHDVRVNGEEQVLYVFGDNVSRRVFPNEMSRGMVKESGRMIFGPTSLPDLLADKPEMD